MMTILSESLHFKFGGTTGLPAEIGRFLRKGRINGYDMDVVPKEH